MLVRTDLTIRQQLVQAAHATLEAGIHLTQDPTDISSLVVCGVASEAILVAEHERLQGLGIQSILFREPDLNGQATALATEIIQGPQRAHFRHHQLWDGKSPKDPPCPLVR